MLEEAELHVLAAHGRVGIILFAVVAQLFEHLRLDFEPSICSEGFERIRAIKIVVKLAVASDTGEGPAVDEFALPQPTKTPMSDILVAANQPHKLRGRRKTVAEYGIKDVQITVSDLTAASFLGPDEFRKACHMGYEESRGDHRSGTLGR